ncbi:MULTISPECIES: tRNA cyclic N6-threonylcarbamoyladenosine(37) synthase TcdA [unclassified Salinivibrio]|uniref:tRNA cyclic N6-threonylcarbamoyladenosine(37) synthase TcdA n=1 Tax=unclassified Salinivibrio TaxID=2636825 RepID=UPI0009853CF7|nr:MULTISPECIES: tRNA cyclic N6-threonylcarbamoyladenosine(37) synthase TcdA [unclassified Salinivibrio]OOF10829.1 tRNA cyclic N6-threonylcarbamoyladenosine(37) synthase TcdA [Salinivibrio sp. PR5]OOF13556.1 tRNA cyclic N6-threonylcarbamoyladenosine(37) synthase TcdA [Salinivibrio sp. PR919]OOF19272.1 tRNA cyclic N6-threonylcarbamoyladenosine(37) synthase TcdA [Salinivibrio sp. PR932]
MVMTQSLSESYLQRFGGTARLYGRRALEVFHQSHICVIGIGGVGSWAVESLVRTGIGAITLIDMDDVCVTNTNRQIHALKATIGQSKSEVMAERVAAINPECQVTVIDDFISPDNIAEYIDKRFDYVLDAIDSIKPKTALLAYCKRHKIKVITVGGAGGQIDPTQIQVADLTKTIQDPLAAKLRNNLRRFYGFTKTQGRKFGIDCVFSSEQLKYPQPDGSVCESKASAQGPKRMDCASGFGAATMVTASFGFVAVSRILHKLIEADKRRQAD